MHKNSVLCHVLFTRDSYRGHASFMNVTIRLVREYRKNIYPEKKPSILLNLLSLCLLTAKRSLNSSEDLRHQPTVLGIYTQNDSPSPPPASVSIFFDGNFKSRLRAFAFLLGARQPVCRSVCLSVCLSVFLSEKCVIRQHVVQKVFIYRCRYSCEGAVKVTGNNL